MIFPAGDLPAREAGVEPNRLDYGPAGDRESLREYLSAWHLWRVIRRDAGLTELEWEFKIYTIEWALERRKAGLSGVWSR